MLNCDVHKNYGDLLLHKYLLTDNDLCSYWTGFGGSDDPLSLQVENALNAYYANIFHNNVSTTTTQTNNYCLTARVDERKFNLYKFRHFKNLHISAFNNYTYRTCVSYYIDTAVVNPTLCELINTIISSQNRYGGSFSCRVCGSGDYCNDHVLSAGDGLSDDSDTTPPETDGTTRITLAILLFTILVSCSLVV